MDEIPSPPRSSTPVIVVLALWMSVVTLLLAWGVIRVWPMAAVVFTPPTKAAPATVAAAEKVATEMPPAGKPEESPPPPPPEVQAREAADRAVEAAEQSKSAAGEARQSADRAAKPAADALPFGDQGTIVILILVLGATGAQIHALQSFSDFVGNGTFANRWFFWYVKRPVIGALLALTVYAVIGGGVLGLDAAFGEAGGNLWGLTGICLLSGMFSRLVTDKLYEVFATLLAVKPQDKIERNDGLSESPPAAKPVLVRLDPASVSLASRVPVKITGKNFTAKCRLRIGDQELDAQFNSTTELELPATGLPTQPGKYGLVVIDSETKAESSPATSLEITA